jgi:hypothetical protein
MAWLTINTLLTWRIKFVWRIFSFPFEEYSNREGGLLHYVTHNEYFDCDTLLPAWNLAWICSSCHSLWIFLSLMKTIFVWQIFERQFFFLRHRWVYFLCHSWWIFRAWHAFACTTYGHPVCFLCHSQWIFWSLLPSWSPCLSLMSLTMNIPIVPSVTCFCLPDFWSPCPTQRASDAWPRFWCYCSWSERRWKRTKFSRLVPTAL